MKKYCFLVLAILVLSVGAFATEYYDLDVTYTEVPYRPVYAFLGLAFEAGSDMVGGAITMTSARDRDIQLTAHVGYRSFSSYNAGSFDVLVGGTYFPRRPTFMLDQMPVRLRMSALGGMGMAEGIFFTMCMSAGLVFSSGDDPSGFLTELAFWPGFKTETQDIPGTMAIRFGFLFAPNE